MNISETSEVIEPLGVAKALKEVVGKENPKFDNFGKTSDDSNQTGQMLAALLELPQGTFASEVEIGDGSIQVLEKLMLDFKHLYYAAIVTTDLRRTNLGTHHFQTL